ncbi:thiolase domain-containing protein [Mycobacterium paraffinicum]
MRKIPHRTTAQIHAEVAVGALADAGLTLADVDGYFCDSTAGFGPISMTEYLGLKPRFVDSTETGGSSYIVHVGHAAAAIAAGKCRIALITMAGRPRSAPQGMPAPAEPSPETTFEESWGMFGIAPAYALAAQRHMYEYGTTSAQLAEVKVAAAHHAQHNPNAMLRDPVTVEQVLESPMVSDPLHRLDCCVVSDGGGAIVVVDPSVAKDLGDRCVSVLGQGEAVKHTDNGNVDLTYTAAVESGPRAFAEAGVTPDDIDYVSIYDSFTITALVAIEDLGFCPKGKGGVFVQNGALQAPHGVLPFNTDGGGLCNNHPSNRGGVTKVIEAVRQLRGEAHPEVQVPDCELALAHGTGGSIGTRMGSATLIMGRSS